MNGPEEAVQRKIIHFLDIVRCSAYVSDLLTYIQHSTCLFGERFDGHLSFGLLCLRKVDLLYLAAHKRICPSNKLI